MRPGRSLSIGAALSLGVHLGLALVLTQLPNAAQVIAAARASSYQVALEPVGHPSGVEGATRRGDAPQDADRLTAGGAESAQNVDARDRGRGGDASGSARAILLTERADTIVLFDSPLNNLAAARAQRIRTSRSRATLERRRATPTPNNQAFLASGVGAHLERRPVSAQDAARGARQAPVASVLGGRPAEAVEGAPGAASPSRAGEARGAAPSAESEAESGTAAPSPGTGILQGAGARRGQAARVAHGRPPVDEGPAATPAETQDARVRDDVDAELLAASLTASWVQASTRSGRTVGPGRGGVGGGGAPGVGGGRREGGRATTHGPGDGRFAALDTSDARYRRWFLRARRRVQEALVFPEARALAMDQGTTIFAIVVRRDGSLEGAPRLVRSSGFPDMDRAARVAIAAATPLSALPDDLAPGLERIPIRLPIDFDNPMVR